MKRDLKLRLKLHKEDESELQRWSTEQHSLEKWFAAELLQSIDYDGIRRFLVIPTGANANEGDSLMVCLISASRGELIRLTPQFSQSRSGSSAFPCITPPLAMNCGKASPTLVR
jgi:hypothetical protein